MKTLDFVAMWGITVDGSTREQVTGFWAFRGDGARNGDDYILSYTQIREKASKILFSSAEKHMVFSLLNDEGNQTKIMALDINGPRFYYKSNSAKEQDSKKIVRVSNTIISSKQTSQKVELFIKTK